MQSKPLMILPLLVMLIIGVTLPSDGNHGVTSPKSLAFLSTAFFIFLYMFIKQKINMRQLKLLGLLMGSLSFLLIWFAIGILQRETTQFSQVDQLKLFILTLSVVIMIYYVLDERLIDPGKIFKTIIYANFTYSVLKSVLTTAHILKVINIFSITSKLGIRFMSMDIHSGIIRMQTSVDIVTPFLLFFVLQSDRLGFELSKNFKRLYIFFSLLSIFYSFSRYLMFVALASILLYWMTLNISKILRGILLACLIAIVGTIVAGVDNTYKVIERRLFSVDNYYSDQARVEQIEALGEEFFKVPLLGKGLGGYAPDVIRDPVILHSYEVQWMAFLMQFGMIGITILVLPLLIIASGLLKYPYSRVRWSFIGLFALWLLSGFTNPFLISLASGLMYSLFMISYIAMNRIADGEADGEEDGEGDGEQAQGIAG